MDLSQAPYPQKLGWVVLLVLAAAAGAQEGRWLDSLAAGKQQALATRKPVLCVLLKPGARNSKRLERDLEKSRKITALLDSFVCVKLDNGMSPSDVANDVLNSSSMPAYHYGFFVGAAIDAYCPRHKAELPAA